MTLPPKTPHAMCARCGHTFPSKAGLGDEVTCPVCDHVGTPARVMRPTGFPSLDAFERSWQRSREAEGLEE